MIYTDSRERRYEERGPEGLKSYGSVHGLSVDNNSSTVVRILPGYQDTSGDQDTSGVHSNARTDDLVTWQVTPYSGRICILVQKRTRLLVFEAVYTE